MMKQEKNTHLLYQASLCDLEQGHRNRTFQMATLRILASDVIANRTRFTRQAIVNALPTLKNIPLVGLFSEETGDFKGHERKLELDEEEGLKHVYNTYPMGVIPESANFWFDEVEENGEIKEYLMVEVLLWKRQKEVKTLRRRKRFNISMEIEVQQATQSNEALEIEDFIFTAVCVLGSHVNGAFKSAELKVLDYSQEEGFKDMMYELDAHLQKQGGGDGMEDNQVIDPVQEPIVEDAPVVEEPQVDEAGVVETPIEETVEVTEPVVEDVTTEETPAEPVVETPQDFEEETPVVEVEEAQEGETDEVVETKDYSAEYEALRVEYNQLVESLMAREEVIKQLTIQVTELEEKCEVLTIFKTEVMAERREIAETEIFTRFESLNDVEGFDLLKENAKNYSLEELENQCYALYGKKIFSEEKTKQKAGHVVVEEPRNIVITDEAFSLLDGFLKK